MLYPYFKGMKMLEKLKSILEYSKKVEESSLDGKIKIAMVFNEHIAQKADEILDNIGFCHKDALMNKKSVKDFSKNLESNIKSLEKHGFAQIYEEFQKVKQATK